jgi:hypothetical protein
VAVASVESRAQGRTFDATRFFCGEDDLIRKAGQTHALTNQWGAGTSEAMDRLLRAFADRGVACSTAEAAE